ncbi:hypothetical protein QOT17_008996 [Balamuthia mandrillaris]
MASPPAATSLTELPPELLSMVFEHIPVRDLFPSCFLICKSLLQVVDSEFSWRQRCYSSVSSCSSAPEKFSSEPEPEAEESSSWKATFREQHAMQWDLHHHTLPPQEAEAVRQEVEVAVQGSCAKPTLSGPKQNLFLCKRQVRWEKRGGRSSYVSVRSKVAFTPQSAQKQRSFEFMIKGYISTHVFGVGLVDDSWDCRLHAHVKGYHPRSWMWWSQKQCIHNIIGYGLESDQVKRHVKAGWERGDVIGVLVNFSEEKEDEFHRSITFFKNGEWMECIAIPPSVNRLWAAVTLYAFGDAVEIRSCRPYSIAAANLGEAKQELEASRAAAHAYELKMQQ